MTSGIEIIDGHKYFVIRDDNGQIVSQEGRDTVVAPTENPLVTAAKALQNLGVPLTSNQRDAIALATLRLLIKMNLS